MSACAKLLLPVRVFECEFESRQRLRFGHMAGNTLRGALGERLWVANPSTLAPDGGLGPSGYHDPPRPFVLRAWWLDRKQFEPGERFRWRLHVFSPPAIEALDPAVREIRTLGRERSEVECLSVREMIAEAADTAGPLVTVDFHSPTELKHEGSCAAEPLFPILFRRIRDRVSTLATAYAAPIAIDYRELGQLSDTVMTEAADVHQVAARRTSRRTGERHALSGFTGTVRYRGVAADLLPWLETARFTGVGRHCVWGKGAISVRYGG